MAEGEGGGGGPGLGALAAGVGAGVAVGAAARVELRLSLALQKSVAGMDCYIKLKSRSGTAEMQPGKKFSILDLMQLSTMHGPVIQVWCSGPDEELAFERLTEAIENGDLVADRMGLPRYDSDKPPEPIRWMFDPQRQMKGPLTPEEANAIRDAMSPAEKRKLATLSTEKQLRLIHLSEEQRKEELAAIRDPSPPEDRITLSDLWWKLSLEKKRRFKRLSKVEKLHVGLMRGHRLRAYLESL